MLRGPATDLRPARRVGYILGSGCGLGSKGEWAVLFLTQDVKRPAVCLDQFRCSVESQARVCGLARRPGLR